MKEEKEISFMLKRNNNEEISFVVMGTIEKKEEYTRIVFDEPLKEKAKTAVDIYKDKVILNRLGMIKTKIVFIPKEETTISMRTKEGFELEVLNYTKLFEKDDSSFHIIYQSEADFKDNLEHDFTIKWSE